MQGFAEAVSDFAGLSPARWLALGGGGYDLQAVARAWTLAYGVMSGQRFDDRIPEEYAAEHGVTSLRDTDDLRMTDQILADSRQFAEASVQSVQRLIFPTHGIRAV